MKKTRNVMAIAALAAVTWFSGCSEKEKSPAEENVQSGMYLQGDDVGDYLEYASEQPDSIWKKGASLDTNAPTITNMVMWICDEEKAKWLKHKSR